MRHIKQGDDKGCGPACLAMVAGLSYEEALRALFPKKEDCRGTRWKELLKALKKLKIKHKKKRGPKGLEECRTAIVAVSWGKRTVNWHFVVYHNKKIYDPELKEKVTLETMLIDFPVIRSYVKIN